MKTCERCNTEMGYTLGERRSLTWECPQCHWKIFTLTAKQVNLNHCDDCGKPFDPPLSKENLQEQWKQRDNRFYAFACDECIASGHTLAKVEEDGTVVAVDETAEIHLEPALGPGKKEEQLH